jgi:transcriptional regulator with XRE-family HTH domain
MKPVEEEAGYFRVALLYEMAARGRGIQGELARKSGISLGLISDLKKGRTGGSPEKREALASALGFSYQDFIAKGKKLEKKRLRSGGGASSPEGEARDEKSQRLILSLRRRLAIFKSKISTQAQEIKDLSQELIAMQKKHISAQEDIIRLQREDSGPRGLEETLDDPTGGAV